VAAAPRGSRLIAWLRFALTMTLSFPSQILEIADSIDRSALCEVPDEFWIHARKETLHHEPGRERRRDRRFSLITNVIAVPLDRRLRPSGPAFVALSSGMSVSGIRLIYSQPAPSERLLFEIEGQPVAFLLSVVRSRPVGECFEIAGRLKKASLANLRRTKPRLELGAVSEVDKAMLLKNNLVCTPSSTDLVQWAGVTAAAELLKAGAPISRN
jgi:hypothetical protein